MHTWTTGTREAAAENRLASKSNDALGRRELCMLCGRNAGLEAGVNARLAAPRVDRLLAHPELRSHLRDLPSPLNQSHDSSPELRRIASPRHIALLLRS